MFLIWSQNFYSLSCHCQDFKCYFSRQERRQVRPLLNKSWQNENKWTKKNSKFRWKVKKCICKILVKQWKRTKNEKKRLNLKGIFRKRFKRNKYFFFVVVTIILPQIFTGYIKHGKTSRNAKNIQNYKNNKKGNLMITIKKIS